MGDAAHYRVTATGLFRRLRHFSPSVANGRVDWHQAAAERRVHPEKGEYPQRCRERAHIALLNRRVAGCRWVSNSEAITRA